MKKLSAMFLLTLLICSTAHAMGEDWIHSDFMSPAKEFPASHASTITETRNGDLLGCWWSGSAEGAPDVQIYCRSWYSNTQQWSNDKDPRVTAKSRVKGMYFPTHKVGNPAILKDSEGYTWMFNTSVRWPWAGWSAASIDYRTSIDDGQSFGDGKNVQGLGHEVRSSPIEIDHNHLLLPIYSDLWNKSGVILVKTKAGRMINQAKYWFDAGKKMIEPALVRLPNSPIVLAYLRNMSSTWLEVAKFDVNQRKWLGGPIQLTIPNSNSPSSPILLSDGRILLLTNNSNTRPRNPLTLLISRDGINFTKVTDIEGTPPPRLNTDDYAYCNMIRVSDGTIHISYTWGNRQGIKHVWFNEADLLSRF